MKRALVFLLALLPAAASAAGDEGQPNTNQYVSAKIGFYHPAEAMNNGLMLGLDGISEFVHYNFFLSLAVDCYPKQSVGLFANPQPDGSAAPQASDQQLLLFPMAFNAAYKVADVPDADLRAYVGAGGGYYYYSFSATVTGGSGGLLGGLTQTSDTKHGGKMFGSLFARVLAGRVFVEPRAYFAGASDDAIGGKKFTVDPSGYSITLGFQYH